MKFKLYMILLGCRPEGRHVEQHDYFFVIAENLLDVKPMIREFWPEASNVHIDAWRTVTFVQGYRIRVVSKKEFKQVQPDPKLFFINLGGYQKGKFEEQHYSLLTVKAQKADAFREAKETLFYSQNHFGTATSHIDDRYGVDVDDLYDIEDILPLKQQQLFSLQINPFADAPEDELHLGYLKMSAIK